MNAMTVRGLEADLIGGLLQSLSLPLVECDDVIAEDLCGGEERN